MPYSLPKACAILIFGGMLTLFSQFAAQIKVSLGSVIGIALIIVICLAAMLLQKLFHKIRYPLLDSVVMRY